MYTILVREGSIVGRPCLGFAVDAGLVQVVGSHNAKFVKLCRKEILAQAKGQARCPAENLIQSI